MIPLSNSEIQDFKKCKRKWWLKYYRQLSPIKQDVSRPRDVGTLVHAVVDAYYQNNFSRDDAEATLLALAEEMDLTDDDQAWIFETSQIMLDGYFNWLEETGVDSHLEIVAPEREVAVPFEGAVLLGKLDLTIVDRSVEKKGFLETKTVQNFSDRTSWMDLDEQTQMYHILSVLDRGDWDGEPDVVYLNLLRRTKRTRRAKPPFFDRVVIYHSADQLKSFYKRTVATVRDLLEARQRLDSGEDHLSVAYPTPSKDCNWSCSFRAVCPMVDDSTDHESYLSAFFSATDQYERYVDVYPFGEK